MDLLYIGLMLAFFALSAALVAGLDSLRVSQGAPATDKASSAQTGGRS